LEVFVDFAAVLKILGGLANSIKFNSEKKYLE
jgi:hypothetical protein